MIQTKAIRKEREIKVIQFGKKEEKLSLFADNIILYIEIPKDSIKKLLELINSVNLQNTKSICKNLFHFYSLIVS